MSLQVFLQAQLSGAEKFLGYKGAEGTDETQDFLGRCAWLTLLCEVLPRTLLAELKLSRMLLGSSSAEQFLLVLTEEDIPHATEFLNRAAASISQLSRGSLRLVWASTENLGAWPVVRKRLEDALLSRTAAPVTDSTNVFEPFPAPSEEHDDYFQSLALGLAAASRVGCGSENPARLTWDQGEYSWALQEQSSLDDDGLLFPRRFAADEGGAEPSSPAELGERAQGASKWAILRGDVDHFEAQLKRAASIEEHIHLSVLFKEFFAGELALLCTMPDFWRKISIVYRGGDDFTVLGSWDALILLARELQRVFDKFVEQHLATMPGVEAKTISMALALAADPDTPLSHVFQNASAQLRAAKTSELGSFYLFGRALEWKRLADAEELKTNLVRLVSDFRCSPEYIHDVASVYREAFGARAGRRSKTVRVDKPWRSYMRLSRVIPQGQGREFSNTRNAVISSLAGTRAGGFKLRPSARVGLEWARLAIGT